MRVIAVDVRPSTVVLAVVVDARTRATTVHALVTTADTSSTLTPPSGQVASPSALTTLLGFATGRRIVARAALLLAGSTGGVLIAAALTWLVDIISTLALLDADATALAVDSSLEWVPLAFLGTVLIIVTHAELASLTTPSSSLCLHCADTVSSVCTGEFPLLGDTGVARASAGLGTPLEVVLVGIGVSRHLVHIFVLALLVRSVVPEGLHDLTAHELVGAIIAELRRTIHLIRPGICCTVALCSEGEGCKIGCCHHVP